MSITVRVTIDGRKYLVDFDDKGEPLRVKERCKYGEYPIEGYYNRPCWSAEHHATPKRGLIFRALEEAKKRHATP